MNECGDRDQVQAEREAEPNVVRRTVDLDVPVEQLWQLVADPARMAEWLGDAVDIDVQPGGTGAIVDDGVLKFVHVDRIDAGRRLSFSWWEPDQPEHTAQVVFEVAPVADGGSRLHITETLTAGATASGEARLSARARQLRWEARVCTLWACTVVAALIA
jgi:uncharacterized protein YndB with AHSA1/START domain